MTATLSHASSAATTVTVTAVEGAYTVGSDATIVIAAGSTSNATDSVTITAVNDDIDNVGDRSVTVTGAAANTRTTDDLGTMTVTGAPLTLTDDEATPTAALALSEPDAAKPDTIDESGEGQFERGDGGAEPCVERGGDADGRGGGGNERRRGRFHAFQRDDADRRGGFDDEHGRCDGDVCR